MSTTITFKGHQLPTPGSVWKHADGELYQVIMITNMQTMIMSRPGDDEKFPPSIVYCPFGQASDITLRYSTQLSRWFRRFTLHQA
jgi:hypothetical protein